MTFTNSISLPEQVFLFLPVFNTNTIRVNLECRYKAQVKVASGEFDVQEKPEKKILVFDIKVLSTIEPLEELKDPETRVYQHHAGKVVAELRAHWIFGERVPSKIEVLQFVFEDSIDKTNLISRLSSVTHQSIISDKRRSTNQDIYVLIKLTYQNNLDILQPVEEDVTKFIEEIIITLSEMKDQTTFVSEKDINSIEDIQFTLSPIQSHVMLVGYGQLDSQFALNFYKNVELTQSTSRLIMGRTLFATAEWKNPIIDVEFYLDLCRYSCGDDFIDIIKV